jgi:hypothetical protein
MRKTTRNIRAISLGITANLAQSAKSDASDLIPGPKLRAKLGISPVTLWRWRHDETSGFRPPRSSTDAFTFPWAPFRTG